MRPDFSQSLLPHSLGRHSYFFFPYCQHNGMFCFHDVLFVKITMLLKCQRILACSDLCRQSLGRGSWASGHNGSKGSHKTSLRGYLHCQNKKKIKSWLRNRILHGSAFPSKFSSVFFFFNSFDVQHNLLTGGHLGSPKSGLGEHKMWSLPMHRSFSDCQGHRDYVRVWRAVSKERMELTFSTEILPHDPHSSPGVSRGNEPQLPAPESSSLMHSVDFNHP